MKLIPISHKKPECIGCALCAEVAPTYFEMDEDGEAQLVRVVRQQGKFQYSEGFEDDREVLEAAEEGCPVDIIKIG